jgi:hypothetical protein
MAFSATIEMVAEDDLPAITYTIKDQNAAAAGQELDPRDSDTWAIIDLTGFTISVDVRVKATTDVIETLPIVILDAVNGLVLLDIEAAEFVNNAGQYEVETRVIAGGGGQQTIYNFMLIKVRSRINSLVV